MTEVKPGKDKPKPAIPPALLPDSGTRCKWIVAQIEGGRDSLTVSYRKYCPDDCRKLERSDSAGHEKLCREPGPGPKPVPHDSGIVPPKPVPGDDTCKMLMERLSQVKPGEPGRAELEHAFAARCKDPIPPRPAGSRPGGGLPLPCAPADKGRARGANRARARARSIG